MSNKAEKSGQTKHESPHVHFNTCDHSVPASLFCSLCIPLGSDNIKEAGVAALSNGLIGFIVLSQRLKQRIDLECICFKKNKPLIYIFVENQVKYKTFAVTRSEPICSSLNFKELNCQ